jgi:hypothetical protein
MRSRIDGISPWDMVQKANATFRKQEVLPEVRHRVKHQRANEIENRRAI